MDSPSRTSAGLRRWQEEWSLPSDLAERQLAAVRSSSLAAAALRESSRAYRRDLNSHADGVTVVSILKLLDHLRFATGLEPESADVDDICDLIPAVRIAASAALERADEAAGAHATLGELCLVSGDQASPDNRELALRHYAEAGASVADREALLDRLRLFAALGFRPGLVAEAIQALGR